MESLFHAISVISAAVVGGSFSAVWEGAVLVVCAALCIRLLPGLSAAVRSAVWLLVFLLIVLLQVLSGFPPSHQIVVGPVHAPPLHLDLRWSVILTGLWAALSLWKGIQLVLAAIRLHGMAGRATPVQPDAVTQELLQGVNGRRSAELCTSDEVERPSVFGFLRPRILLPPGLVERLSPEQLQQVVLHEMEHVRRADDWTNLLQKVGLVLFPLNPVLLWVERRLCAERELACDDRVLHSHCGRKAYAVCLTRLAEYSMLHRGVSLVLGAWDKRPELVRRVHRILRRPDEPMSGRRAAMVTASLVVGLLSGAAALSRSPQLVSFVPAAHFSPHSAAQTIAQVVAGQPSAKANLRATARTQATAQTQMTRDRGPREIRASAHEGSAQQGSLKLVKAVMSQSRSQASHGEKEPRAIAVKQAVKRQRDLRPQNWVVLTEWRDGEPAEGMVIAVAQNQQTSYAAVQIADGWLIVQI